jgi:hypothetical protein
LLIVLAVAGCFPARPRSDADSDADTDTDGDAVGPTEELDLLFVLDDSGSMREEQLALTGTFTAFVDMLTSFDLGPVTSLHFGIVSGDMGTGGYPVTSCEGDGDDGVLQHTPTGDVTGCDATYPTFLTLDAAAPDEAFSKDFSCIGSLGEGCGFQQVLAAAEKALTVHTAPGGANEGFLRTDSLIAVIVVTDGDDCSVSDPAIFGEDDSLGPLNLRCYYNPEMVRPLDELSTSLLRLRPDRPQRVIFGAIAGVPSDLVATEATATGSFDAMLADPRMVETVDYSTEGGGMRLVPSCDVPGVSTSYPPRRLVEMARDVDEAGGGGILFSICRADWTDEAEPLRSLIARLAAGDDG